LEFNSNFINVFEINFEIQIQFKLYNNVVGTSISYKNGLVSLISRTFRNFSYYERIFILKFIFMFLILVQIKNNYCMLHIASYHFSSSLHFTSLALSTQVMHVKSVSQMVPHDHQTKRTKVTKAIYARTSSQQDLRGYCRVGTKAPFQVGSSLMLAHH